ncbi:MAG: flagellar hook-basal body protein [Oscillospiraceae bacterium]|nr:flagellar hook-basal body protein [Oscillospiraceae bacterium]
MYEAKSIAATALRNQQTRLDTIANNVANANTVAFKGGRLDFKDALYTAGLTPSYPRSPEENQQKGHGVMISHIGREFRPGNLERTEQPLDLAIEGEGWFSLIDANGDILYTRNGSFNLSVEADATYLVSGEGLYVLDVNGARIPVPFGINSIEVDVDGTMRFLSNNNEVSRATLGIYTFRNVYGLSASGNGNFIQTPAAGERLVANEAVVRQGMLESSNVSLAEEMTRLIRTQRAFQLASRALTTADEMEGIANNMRR